MTDDETRKAFEEYYLGQSDIEVPLERSGNGYKFLVADAVWHDWQAAWAEATKRERERCLSLVRSWSLVGDRSSTMVREIEEGEEPKP